MAPKQEQDRIQRVPPHLADFLFGDLCKRQSGRSLEIDIVAEGEGSQGGKGGTGEKVGGRPV
jgi:hypothetical protein